MSGAYRRALSLGQRDRRSSGAENLPVLDEKQLDLAYREPLGVVDIPMHLIAGTLTEARAISFSPHFYPTMEPGTEFADKWTALSNVHLDEGIRDPIKAIEYLGRFYVIEGNKRVSVLKYYGAVSIPGSVTRYVPNRTPKNGAYYEYLDFYRATGLNSVIFEREGGYAALEKAMGRTPGAPWSADEIRDFRSFFSMFRAVYLEQGGEEGEEAEAALMYLGVFDYQETLHKLPKELAADLTRLRPELDSLAEQSGVEVLTEDAAKKPLLYLGGEARVAFVHADNPHDSAWAYTHELGRRDLEAALDLKTLSFENANTPELAAETFDAAAEAGANVVFVTSPQLSQAAVKAAVRYPQVKFLNCSLGLNTPSVRGYYARTYEARFLLGTVAGALTKNDKINYIAESPTLGAAADINAFALGARMVNPRAQVLLEWVSTEATGSRNRLSDAGVTYVAEADRHSPYNAQMRQNGLYLAGESSNIGMSLYRWGEIYIKIVRRILDGSWKNDAHGSGAVNYWWGMSNGAVDILLSRRVPQGTRQLAELLHDALCSGRLACFQGELRTQSGEKLYFHEKLSPKELLKMDWLIENVIGEIPHKEQLTEEARTQLDSQKSAVRGL